MDPRGRFPHTYEGVVVDNVDPLGLHRVRIDVLDDVTRLTTWARPLTSGGGSAQRGGHIVPAIGAAVAVRFLNGDIERPIYETLGWSKAESLVEGEPAGEAPAALRDVPAAEAHLIQSFQVGPLELVLDERPGQRKAIVRDVEVDDCFILWDLEKKGLQVKMRSAIVVHSVGTLVLNAINVLLKRRVVVPSAKAI